MKLFKYSKLNLKAIKQAKFIEIKKLTKLIKMKKLIKLIKIKK